MDNFIQKNSVDPLLKAADVAKRLNISKTSAYRLMRTNIPCVRLGIGIIRVRPSDLESFIKSRVEEVSNDN